MDRGRGMKGFLNINKPRGITSFGVIEVLRKVFNVRKMGHAGNLDPHAKGVLVVGIGSATRFLPYIMDLEKEYLATIMLGKLTDTLDETGQILDTKEVPPFDMKRLKEVLSGFVGEITQTPPPFSAVKVKGERLYDLAREGVLVSPKPKKVRIFSIEILDLNREHFTIKVVCGKGTYIRSLARDIAGKLGTYGMVGELTRRRVGDYSIENAVELDDPDLPEKLIKIDEALSYLPKVVVKEKAAFYFSHGNKVGLLGITSRDKEVRNFILCRVYDARGKFLGLGIHKWDGVYPKRLLPTDD